MSAVSRLRIALRIARRSSRRAPGRSALIVALIALPVAGMAAVMLVLPSTHATTAERVRVQLGETQAYVQVVSSPGSGVEQDPFSTGWGSSGEQGTSSEQKTLDELFAPGTPMIPVRQSSVTVRTKAGVGVMNVTEGETWSPTLRGAYKLSTGRAPEGADEILATQGALKRLGATVGGRVDLIAPVAREVTVVGVLDDRARPSSMEQLFGQPAAFGDQADLLSDPQSSAYLPNTVLDWDAVKHLNTQGAVAVSRHVAFHPPKPGEYNMSSGDGGMGSQLLMAAIIIGFALLEVTLLAGAAFMVGARAQERSLATVASVGAPRSTLLSIITSNGLVLGAVGGVVGVGAGIGIGSVFMAMTDNGSATRYWGYHLSWPIMAGVALAAVAIGWLGALVPAVRASRIDIVAALRGARRPSPIRRRRPIVGVVLMALGVAVSLAGGGLLLVANRENQGNSLLSWASVGALVGGPIIIQLGLILCCGLILRVLARVFTRGAVSGRLAARDAARNPGRSVPALAVVMTTVFVAVFAMAMISSTEVTGRANYEYQAQIDQVRMRLIYWDENTVKPIDAADAVSAVRTGMDVDAIATLKAVSDPRTMASQGELPEGATPKTLVPSLAIPDANQCALDYGSVNYDMAAAENGTTENAKALADWRCQDRHALQGSWTDGDGQIWVGTAADLAVVIGAKPSAEARAALAAGDAVALHPQYLENGRITLEWRAMAYWQDPEHLTKHPAAARTAHVNGVLQKTDHSLPYGVFISAKTAEALGLHYENELVLASTASPPTQEQIDATNAAMDTVTGIPGGYYTNVERGPSSMASGFAWALLALAGVVAIGAAAVAIGLARADGRKDQAALTAVGASPFVRRGFGFWQAIILTGVGSVLGAAVGLVPALALTLPGSQTTFAAPWLQIVATAVLMPLVIGAGTWVFSGRGGQEFRRAAIE
ncbi:hypothetical protein OSC27_08695 [Microbacterium sp. STN6]|uniref:FtsX-like permease family protein n=1 Tax=Microbacterium sp. STN6 TaxID=2995588 RepID=UPI0022608129|nr:FtsX-like permease family protein [Microbacterium sp. STN6]MCX7522354.1 hypothetical protein [Microbacterium sp. STN6]